MGIDDYLAIGILVGVAVTFVVCGWMIRDLLDDRRVLKEDGSHRPSMLYNTRDLRNDIIRIIKATAIFIIFYPMVFMLLDWPNHFDWIEPEKRVIPVRICAMAVVWLLPVTAIWDRVTRIQASRSLQEEKDGQI